MDTHKISKFMRWGCKVARNCTVYTKAPQHQVKFTNISGKNLFSYNVAALTEISPHTRAYQSGLCHSSACKLMDY